MSLAARQTDRGPVLGIETSTSLGGVAIFGGGQLRAELLLRSPGSHSENLFPSVERLLELAGVALRDLSAVAVSLGPGSFTGLRVGVAAAKGLAFSLRLPLYGIPTLEVLAASASPGPTPAWCVMDARRGEVFAARVAVREGWPEIAGEAEVKSPADLARALKGGEVVVGELSRDLRSLLSGSCPGPLSFSPPGLAHPRAAAVAARGAEMLAGGVPTQIETLLPIYIRPSDAEANVERKRRRRGGIRN